MYKKLVVFDQWHFTEIDPVRLKRSAQDLKDFIMAKIPTDDQYKVHTRLLPILELAIRGEIYKPFEKNSDLIDGKYLWDKREGLLPPEYEGEFSGRFSEFAVTAEGMAIDQVEPFIQDGITYAYMELEEPDDWPDLVLKLEDERRRVRMGTEYVPVKPY